MQSTFVSCYLALAFYFGLATCLTCNKRWAVEDEPMKLTCYADSFPIDSCEFEFATNKTKIQVYEGVQNPNYEFAGNFTGGVCGIKFTSAKRELQGQVISRVSLPDTADFEEAKVNVTILSPSKNLNLTTNGNYYEFKERETMRFNCTSNLTNPLPNITLSVGGKVLSRAINQSSVNASKVAEFSDFGKKVTCRAFHPRVNSSFSRLLTIFYKPKLSGPEQTGIDANITIRVVVNAYPRPHSYKWTRPNGEELENATSWFQPIEGSMNSWEAGLYVEEPTEEDTKEGFLLTVANEVGVSQMSSFALTWFHATIAIVVFLLLLVAMVFAVVAAVMFLKRRNVPFSRPKVTFHQNHQREGSQSIISSEPGSANEPDEIPNEEPDETSNAEERDEVAAPPVDAPDNAEQMILHFQNTLNNLAMTRNPNW